MANRTSDTRMNEDKRKLKSAGILLKKKGLLVALSVNLLGKTCIVDKPETVIGRDEECDFVLEDPLLSRKHCIVRMDEACDFYLEDLNSTNSTFLNSKIVKKKTMLGYGDRIVLGNTILRFYFEEEIEKK
ncbi:MAG: FHA domain-containing protein [Spirochaetales bacterium]|nr:FHA domain-containing protein [Spirochaetales bacterium]